METASSANYLPLLMQIAVAAGFVIFTLFVTHKLTQESAQPKKTTTLSVASMPKEMRVSLCLFAIS